MEESELIRALQQGSNEAFAELVNQYARMILNTCYRLLLHQQDAEDLAQEVFIEVLQSISTFRGDARLSTWLYRIAVSRSLDELKKRKRAKRFAAFTRILTWDDVSESVAGTAAADAQLLRREREQALQQLLDTLPDNQRVAFCLSKIEGLSIQDIAELMQTSVTAVDSLIYRAKQKMGERLKEILRNTD